MSQKQTVVELLRENGQISRNECLRLYISRLSAIIYDLKKKGWRFKEERRGGDYIYKVEL